MLTSIMRARDVRKNSEHAPATSRHSMNYHLQRLMKGIDIELPDAAINVEINSIMQAVGYEGVNNVETTSLLINRLSCSTYL